jgi:hypothetical protein
VIARKRVFPGTVSLLLENRGFQCPAHIATEIFMDDNFGQLTVVHGACELDIATHNWADNKEFVGSWLIGVCKLSGHKEK